MMTVKALNRFCLLTTAPFVGLMIWLLAANFSLSLPQHTYPEPVEVDEAAIGNQMSGLLGNLDTAKKSATVTAKSIKKSIALYRSTNDSMNQIVKIATTQAGRPAKIYDRRITRKIGTPYSQIQSDNLAAQLFKINAQNFKGYALKVKLKTSKGMKMVLGKDKVGEAETTLAAAKRYNAVAGVNAGGFADNRGKRYPLSTTMMNGKYISGFEPSYKDLFFVGMNKNLELIGGKYWDKGQLDKQEPLFGASFVPVLMKNGVSQSIPDKWQVSPKRAPRTVIANYKDNQLLFLVTDGYNENGSSGATLQEMQILLSRFGAIDGYNLDGGGSSSLIFNGRVVNKPSDGRLRPLPTHFLFFK
ncbi:phosphodiester glycosidase family protein [Paenibacillus oenotherae]|uniref:Phosphodiester glycosidase family protein n=1 Tax=Paenibacillus oenotherae TaxID=1435645 RepID=A0ABS7D3A6_9BACL|nr:phosphodiester glycosidase family protein [Paenibacillus oenotherae]MBW7474339.1 phosphodiester glycosidase family protein [Paenibacillus oenotherae]